MQKKMNMRNLLVSILISLLWAAPAVAHGVKKTAKTRIVRNDMQDTQSIEQYLRTRLVGAGFSDIEIVRMPFAARAKDVDGNEVFLLVSPVGTKGDPFLLIVSPDGLSERQLP
jgi:hypothetical protein